jgi:PIN domain nuclease of toxin-antitoxin system
MCFATNSKNGLVLEPVTLKDILALSALPALHRDPFDRLIIAYANRGGFRLVTHDPELARSVFPALNSVALVDRIMKYGKYS